MKLHFFLYTFILSLLASCSSSSGDSDIPNSVPTASSVIIIDGNGGDAVVGDTLKGNYIYADEEGDDEGISTYSWLRNGAIIGGETASTYTLVLADSGQSITFKVTPVATTGNAIGNAVTSTPITVFNAAPTVSSVNIIDDNGGDVLVGDSLTGSYIYNDAEGDVEGVSTYRWLRNGAAITGATATIYTLVVADSDQSITFEVTPVAVTGTILGTAVTSSSLSLGTRIISHKNFSVLASELQPSVYDSVAGTFTAAAITITIMIGDRDNQLITDSHTIFFVTEWGLIEPSCVTSNGSCSVTWQTASFGSIPSDYLNTITAYAVGEESFIDTNGNSVFDDADSVFDDLEEPFIDENHDGIYDIGEMIIDVVNGNNLTGINGVHDIGDTFLNSPACSHSSLCSAVSTTTFIWDDLELLLTGPP